MYFKRATATGRLRHHTLILCLLLVLLNGCAVMRPKKVSPPPAKPVVSAQPAEVASPPAQKRPPVTRPPREDRVVGTRPPVVGRLPARQPIQERPAVIEPPIEERTMVTEPPVEERIEREVPVEERSRVTPPPTEEPPAVAEDPVREEPPAPIEPPGDYKPVTGKAAAIYNQAEEAMQAGNYASAELLLERALRIEPRNAHYWYTLGLAKFRQKQYAQTVQFCLKAESLAGSQPGLMARNQVLLTQAKKAEGLK